MSTFRLTFMTLFFLPIDISLGNVNMLFREVIQPIEYVTQALQIAVECV